MVDELATVTLLVASIHQDGREQDAYDQLAERLKLRLDQPVIPFAIDQEQQSLPQLLGELLRIGIGRVITLPLFLSPTEYRRYQVSGLVDYANQRWPFMQHHVGAELDWSAWLTMIGVCVERTLASDHSPSHQTSPEGEVIAKTAVILVGHGDADSAVNSDLAKLARLFYEAHDFGWVDVAFLNQVPPTLSDLIECYGQLGARQIIVVPFMLFAGDAFQQILFQVEVTQSRSTGESADRQATITVVPCLSPDDVLIDQLLAQHQGAWADRSRLPPTPEELNAQIQAAIEVTKREKRGVLLSDVEEFQVTRSKIDAILPPRYQGAIEEVSASPMSAADLVFNDDGTVLWDQIFGVDDPNNPYCELALAGGPSHRGELLEAVSGADCLAEPARYAAALAECGRGINMITGMEIVESTVPGWLGVECDSEEMAIWLMRAIIVENVLVRRQKKILYLPVGPHYTLKDQIKSIVTVTAKTWHYWIEHITYQELVRVSNSLGIHDEDGESIAGTPTLNSSVQS